jgi:hypothetical protein
VAIAICGASALQLAVPGAVRGARALGVSVAALAAWAVLAAVANSTSGLDPSTFMRAHCQAQALAWSLPPLALGVWIVRRRAALSRATSGLLIGAVAGAIPALAMELACQYGEVAHALRGHFMPIAGVAAAGALAGRLLFPRI